MRSTPAVLDGDIDAEWIESMNTVMDDNKMLTLASNERIPLTPSMRLLLEINHMNHCSPATVSRGGVIYVNADDVGWKPVVDSWIERLEASEYRWVGAVTEVVVVVQVGYVLGTCSPSQVSVSATSPLLKEQDGHSLLIHPRPLPPGRC